MIIVTRPKDFSIELVAELEKYKVSAFSIPLIELKALNLSKQNEKQLSNYCHTASTSIHLKHIFVSPAAVRFAHPYIQKYFPMLQHQTINDGSEIYAIGKRTEKTLKSIGFSSIQVAPSPYNSEALLSLDTLQTELSQSLSHCLLWSILGGRELLKKTLSDRGFIVHHLPIYHQVGITLNPQNKKRIESFRQQKIPLVITATSQSIVQQLCHTPTLCHQNDNLVCLSERIAHFARQKRIWQNISIAEQANNQSLISKLMEIEGGTS